MSEYAMTVDRPVGDKRGLVGRWTDDISFAGTAAYRAFNAILLWMLFGWMKRENKTKKWLPAYDISIRHSITFGLVTGHLSNCYFLATLSSQSVFFIVTRTAHIHFHTRTYQVYNSVQFHFVAPPHTSYIKWKRAVCMQMNASFRALSSRF